MTGRLQVYFGMAPGVGKTYRMLTEARGLLADGARVAIGILDRDLPPVTAGLATWFEAIPPRRIDHRGIVLEELDALLTIATRPDAVVIDSLAHRNLPGSDREWRWQDVEAIRAAGIDVLATCDVGHLDAVADAVETITASAIVERIPAAVLDGADEIALVDVTPRELRARIIRGDLYPADRAMALLSGPYAESNLAALRELTVRFVADSLARRLEPAPVRPGPAVTGMEHVLVALDDRPVTRRAIRRAAALAGAGRRTLAAAIIQSGDGPRPGSERASRLRDNAAYAIDLGAEIVRYAAPDTASGLEHVIRTRRVTHLVMAHRRRTGLARWLGTSIPDLLADRIPDLEIDLVADTGTSDAERALQDVRAAP